MIKLIKYYIIIMLNSLFLQNIKIELLKILIHRFNHPPQCQNQIVQTVKVTSYNSSVLVASSNKQQ